MAQKLQSKEFYSAAQTKEILGITDGMLYNYVDNGALERIIPPGKKQGVYRSRQVDQLARELKVFVITRKKITSTFAKATKEDVPECANISQAIFNAHYDVRRQRAWMDKNPDICYVVKSEGKVVGYVLFQPLPLEKIEKILQEEESSLEVETKEIERFTPGKHVHLYIASIAIIPGITLTEKRHYAARLIGGLINVLINFGKQGIIIDTIASRSSTADGIRLMRGMGFTEIPSITRRHNFIIEVKKSGIREIMQYKQALLESGVVNEAEYQLVPTLISELRTSTAQNKINPSSSTKTRQKRAVEAPL